MSIEFVTRAEPFILDSDGRVTYVLASDWFINNVMSQLAYALNRETIPLRQLEIQSV